LREHPSYDLCRLRSCRFVAPVVAAAVLALVAASTGAAMTDGGRTASAGSCQGTSITIGTNADANNINPILAVDLDGRWRTDLMFSPLVLVNPTTLQAMPNLAQRWSLSKDGRSYTFYLNPKAKWQDGKPLTASDVAFTVMSILSPKYQGAFQKDWSRLVGASDVISGSAQTLSGVKVVNAHTIQFTLIQPYAGFLTVMARNLKPIPEHLLKDAGTLTTASSFSQHPVGSGPYQFSQWVPGNKFVAIAWPKYWGNAACMKQITQAIIPDANTLSAALQSGQIDASIIPPPSALPALQATPTLKVYQLPPLTAEGLEFNMKKEPWKSNVDLRQAIAYGIDYRSFAKQFMGDPNPRPAAFYSWASWAHNPVVKMPSYDLAKAKQLLAKAGYPDGKGLTINLSTNSGNAFRAQEVTYLQSQLGKLGITVNITSAVWGTFIAAVTDHSYDIAAMNNADNAGIPDPTSFDPSMTCGSGANYSGYCNPVIDRLFANASASTDQKKRKALYGEIQGFLRRDLPFLPGFWRPNVLVVKKSIKNVKPAVIGAYWNIWNWSNK
jgi:peptide/nickel transport system substrate-binding protein